MANIVFTPSAKQLAQRLLDELLQEQIDDGDEQTGGHVALLWSHGNADNRRGPSGEVIWETSGPFGWLCLVVPNITEPPPPLREIDGLQVFVDLLVGSAAGTLLVDVVDGTLGVAHRTT